MSEAVLARHDIELTGGVAHDFNNLLTVIRSSVDLLMRPNITEERRRRYIEAISETTTRATKLTSQLLSFSRRQALAPEVFDVASGLQNVRDLVASLTGARIEIETRIPGVDLFVDADPSQFDIGIINLPVNARDAMDGAGKITMSAAPVTEIPAVRGQPASSGDYVAVSILTRDPASRRPTLSGSSNRSSRRRASAMGPASACRR